MSTDSASSWWSPNLSLQDTLQGVVPRSMLYAPKPHPVRVKEREPEIALGAIKALVSMRQRLDQALRVEVASARAAGCTWQEIAGVLGTSHQAAMQRYAKFDPRYADEGPDSLK